MVSVCSQGRPGLVGPLPFSVSSEMQAQAGRVCGGSGFSDSDLSSLNLKLNCNK